MEIKKNIGAYGNYESDYGWGEALRMRLSIFKEFRISD